MANLINITMKLFTRIESKCISRLYSRNVVFRKPIRVFNSPNQESIKPSLSEISFPKTSEKCDLLDQSQSYEVPAIIKKADENVVHYQKLDKYDAHFTKLLEMLKNRKRRVKSGKMLLEGKRLINDALLVGLKMQALYFSKEEDLRDIKIKNPKEVKISKVLYKTMKVWSDLTTCPGVMAVFNRPTAEELNIRTQPAIPVSILCDNIREPGNLGSIIRNGAAAGCENILLSKGCVDPWDMKVLRAGCGGQFRIPIIDNIEWTQVSNYIPSNSTILIPDNNADMDPVTVGTDFISFDEKGEEEDEIKYVTLNEHNQPLKVDESFDSKDELEQYEDVQLPCHLYSSIKYPKNHIVLYIGGETHGLNPQILKLACEYGGKKIKIPLENGMDSLNSAFALTIVLYEIKRQYSQLYVTK